MVLNIGSSVQNDLQKNRDRARKRLFNGEVPVFAEGDDVLVAHMEFPPCQKLSKRWRGPSWILKAVSDYVYFVDDLCNGELSEDHISRLNFCKDCDLNADAILSHVLQSKTGMPVARLLSLNEEQDALKTLLYWKGLPTSENSLKPIIKVYEDVAVMLERLLKRKNTPPHLAARARKFVGLSNTGV